jgi:chromosome segregation ATPase
MDVVPMIVGVQEIFGLRSLAPAEKPRQRDAQDLFLSRNYQKHAKQGTIPLVRTQPISDRVAALEEELSTLRARTKDETSSFSALESQAADLQQRLAETRARLSENETRLAEKQAELIQARREAAAERYQEAFRAREQAAARVAEAAERVLAELDGYDEATGTLRQVIDDMRAATGDGVTAPDLEGDPVTFSGAWERLEERVRDRIGERLEDELVNEAAQSAMGHAIDDLPEHLRDVAHARRRARIKEYLGKS